MCHCVFEIFDLHHVNLNMICMYTYLHFGRSLYTYVYNMGSIVVNIVRIMWVGCWILCALALLEPCLRVGFLTCNHHLYHTCAVRYEVGYAMLVDLNPAIEQAVDVLRVMSVLIFFIGAHKETSQS